MSDNNRISATVSAAALASIQADIADIRAKLPFLISLTPAERRTIAKLGDGRIALDEDCSQLMEQNPQFIPSYIELAEVDKDRALRSVLDSIRLSLEALHNDVESTEIVVGSELYNAYLAYYANAREAAKRAVASAQSVVNNLSKYFARPGRPATPPATPGA